MVLFFPDRFVGACEGFTSYGRTFRVGVVKMDVNPPS